MIPTADSSWQHLKIVAVSRRKPIIDAVYKAVSDNMFDARIWRCINGEINAELTIKLN